MKGMASDGIDLRPTERDNVNVFTYVVIAVIALAIVGYWITYFRTPADQRQSGGRLASRQQRVWTVFVICMLVVMGGAFVFQLATGNG